MNLYAYKCRACLIKTKNCVDINGPFDEATTLSILECMNLCTGVPASQLDGLPDHICTICHNDLQTTYNFIQKVRESATIFLQEFELPLISDPLLVGQNVDELTLTEVDFEYNVTELKEEPDDEPCLSFTGNISADFEDRNDGFNWADNSQNHGFSDSSDDKPLKSKGNTKKTPNAKKKAVKRKCGRKLTEESSLLEDFKEEESPAIAKRTRKHENISKQKTVQRKRAPDKKSSKVKNKESRADRRANIKTTTEEEIKIKEFSRKNIEVLPSKKVQNPNGEIKNQLQYGCKICGHIFIQKSPLWAHIKFVHMKIRNYLCTFCPKKYPNALRLEEHMRMHNNVRPFKCKQCPKSFTTNIFLRQHLEIHNKKNPHICDICGKGFKQRGTLSGHMFIHTRIGEECSICKKHFARPVDLRKHMVSHTGDKPFKCEICPKSYPSNSSLQGHIKMHSFDKVLCKICGQRLQSSVEWNAHMAEHNNEFHCRECNISFTNEIAYNSHTKMSHSEN